MQSFTKLTYWQHYSLLQENELNVDVEFNTFEMRIKIYSQINGRPNLN